MRPFEFLEPDDLATASRILADHDDEAYVFAGGSALLLGMRQRMLAPEVLVSLGRLEQLREISYSASEGLKIGAMARHSEVARSDAVRTHCPLLAHVAANLANPQVRNQGTIGGNLCYADPTTDPPTALMALDATVTIHGPEGERRLPFDAFLVDFFTTALEPGEILTEIRIPPESCARKGHYRRHLRTLAEHRPIANAGLTYTERNGTWENVRLVAGAALPVAQSLDWAAEYLTGRTIDLAVAQEAADLAVERLDPVTDDRGDAEFRRQMLRATIRRTIADAANLNWKDTE